MTAGSSTLVQRRDNISAVLHRLSLKYRIGFKIYIYIFVFTELLGLAAAHVSKLLYPCSTSRPIICWTITALHYMHQRKVNKGFSPSHKRGDYVLTRVCLFMLVGCCSFLFVCRITHKEFKRLPGNLVEEGRLGQGWLHYISMGIQIRGQSRNLFSTFFNIVR